MAIDDEARNLDLQSRLDVARFAIVALLGTIERVRDLMAGGYFAEARSLAEAALADADAYLRLVEGAENGRGGPA